MKVEALSIINNKLKTIPDNFLNEIVAYLDFISFKATNNDWAEDLTPQQLQSIERGQNDLNTGNTVSHKEAMSRIKAHFKSK